MSKQTHKGSRQEEKLKIISSVKGPVAHMMPEDIGQLVVHASKISGYLPITPSYATDEIGVDNVKVLMATDNLISFESFRSKGAIDAAHSHPDHHSVAYQKQWRVKIQIGKESFFIFTHNTLCIFYGHIHGQVSVQF